MNTITKLTSPRSFRVRFEFLARAGELSVVGKPIPEVAVETSGGGFGEMSRERAERLIARCARMGWAVVTQEAEAPADDDVAPESDRPDASAVVAAHYECAHKVLREARWYRHHDRLLFTACLITARRCRREAREARKRLVAA